MLGDDVPVLVVLRVFEMAIKNPVNEAVRVVAREIAGELGMIVLPPDLVLTVLAPVADLERNRFLEPAPALARVSASLFDHGAYLLAARARDPRALGELEAYFRFTEDVASGSVG